MISLRIFQQMTLFAGMSDDDLKRFLGRSTIRHYEAGETMFTAFDEHHRLFLLLRGVVKTYVISPQGMEQITHVFYRGEVFGGLMFGTQQDPRPWAEALERADVIIVTGTGFKQLMESYPDVCMNVFNYMVDHHQQHIRRLQILLHTKANHRLVRTLLHLGERQGDGDAAQFTLNHGFTHEELANMIGVVRSTLSELMGELRRNGVIITRGRTVTVDRMAAIRFLENLQTK